MMIELRRVFLRTVERGARSKSPEWQQFGENDLIRFEFEREGTERDSFIGRWIVGRWVVRLKRPPEEFSVVVRGMGPAGPPRYKELARGVRFRLDDGREVMVTRNGWRPLNHFRRIDISGPGIEWCVRGRGLGVRTVDSATGRVLADKRFWRRTRIYLLDDGVEAALLGALAGLKIPQATLPRHWELLNRL